MAIRSDSNKEEQTTIKNWFNQTYQTKGFGYLRPLEAYGIYRRLLELQPGDSFLDVACGPGLMVKQALTSGAKAHGIDISDTAIEMARQFVPQADVRVANAEELPFEDGSIDAVTCLGSLERMIHLDKVLQEIHRVGAADARFCFLARNSSNYTWQIFMQRMGLRNKEGHQGAKTLEEWTAFFSQNNFEVVDVLPDQWPFVRWRQAMTLGLYKPDPMVLRKGIKPLNKAYEFIFVLRKKSAA
ncbi:MAG: SAM-dependent methyltransferase [Candidatus Promineifilaceae bacterium]|jgi:SAM-dependent methyltransferase